MNKQKNRTMGILAGAAVLALIAVEPAGAFRAPDSPATASFDKRSAAAASLAFPAQRKEAAAELQARVPGVRIDYDPITGTPAWISRFGLLNKATLEELQGKAGAASADPHLPIKSFLAQNATLFGHGPEVLDNATLTREYITEHNGMHTVVWQQQLDGIPIFDGVLIGNLTRKGQLINISSHFLPEIDKASGLDLAERVRFEAAPPVSAAEAVANALADLGETSAVESANPVSAVLPKAEQSQKFTGAALFGEARARLVWLPLSRVGVQLCWCVDFITRSRLETFQTLVNASSGEVLVRRNLTCNYTSASYRVYSSDSPSPFSPGWSTPSSGQPAVVNQLLLTLASMLSQTDAPLGWIPDGGNSTHGNNVDASLNRTAQFPNPVLPPQGSPFRVFDFPLDLTQQPDTYENAAVVNLFYWCNFMHDKLYPLGFTEAAGNFQDDNFGRGGLQQDRVIAFAQYGADVGLFNNAFFSPKTDGTSPQIWMLLWNSPTPSRDGDLDAELICHEYTHGLSTRLVGGGAGIHAMQSQGMGEGWSDFYAMALLSQPNDNQNGNYAMGAYVAYQWLGLTENYYYGIRRYPYSIAMNKNPLTFKDIDPAQADNCSSGVPYSPLWTAWYGSCAANPADEVHNIGEVWCLILWEARKNLISRLGYVAGNKLILEIVTDAMTLCPIDPDFIQGRDALVQAAQVSSDCGAAWDALWAAFQKRGLGGGASSPGSWTTSGVVESFTPPHFGNPCLE